MLIFLQPAWLLAFAAMAAFFAMGRTEARSSGRDHAFLWAGLSLGVSALVISVIGGGWSLVIIGQGVLFIAIGVIRAAMDA